MTTGWIGRWKRATFTVVCVSLGLRAAPALAAEPPAEMLPAHVIVLANSDDPDSLRIARHYAEVRGVPAANIFALRMPLTESISWREFLTTLWQPLVAELVRAKWVDAIPMAATDATGRIKFAPYGHRIAALVVCRGVPLKIAHDPALYVETPPFTSRGEFRTNAGAVDAELSLLALPNYPINAFVPNPLFQNENPTRFEAAQVVRVSRLDGPSVADAMALVDRAVAAEKTGLLGRAYIDLSNRDPVGNAWLEAAAKQLTELNFDPAVDHAPATMPLDARFDAPAIYFGWYSGTIDGPFLLPDFRFPPGAIALHIHSYSALTLRSATSGWTGPFVARGVTATVGNVNEPYLAFTHRPQLLLRSLAKGRTLVEAAYFALQSLSWQAVLIGDPLYRPFAVPLETQLSRRRELPAALAGYAVLRRMSELERAGKTVEAIEYGRTAQREMPSLPVAVALAERALAAGETQVAATQLGFVPLLSLPPSDQWALFVQAARLLEKAGRADQALAIWRKILGSNGVGRDLRLTWLPEARATAHAAGDTAQAVVWRSEFDAKSTPSDK